MDSPNGNGSTTITTIMATADVEMGPYRVQLELELELLELHRGPYGQCQRVWLSCLWGLRDRVSIWPSKKCSNAVLATHHSQNKGALWRPLALSPLQSTSQGVAPNQFNAAIGTQDWPSIDPNPLFFWTRRHKSFRPFKTTPAWSVIFRF